jgi:hypothetical protein
LPGIKSCHRYSRDSETGDDSYDDDTAGGGISAELAGKYARGWMVGAGNWWHSGSLPGTRTVMARTAAGLCWAALTNTRTQPSDEIDKALDLTMWDAARSVPAWRA